MTVSLVDTTGLLTLPVHAGAVPVHNGSPPPVRVTLLLAGLSVLADTFTGTLIAMLPTPAPVAMVHPASVLPVLGQPVRLAPALVVLPVMRLGAALRLMPVGRMSLKLIGAMVALPVTLMVMV